MALQYCISKLQRRKCDESKCWSTQSWCYRCVSISLLFLLSYDLRGGVSFLFPEWVIPQKNLERTMKSTSTEKSGSTHGVLLVNNQDGGSVWCSIRECFLAFSFRIIFSSADTNRLIFYFCISFFSTYGVLYDVVIELEHNPLFKLLKAFQVGSEPKMMGSKSSRLGTSGYR